MPSSGIKHHASDYGYRKRSRVKYDKDSRNRLSNAPRERNSERSAAGYTYPYPLTTGAAAQQIVLPGLPAHLPPNILDSWQQAPPAPPYSRPPPPEYSSHTHLTAPIAPPVPPSTSSLTAPPTATPPVPQSEPVREVAVPAAPVREVAVPAAPAKEASPPAAPVREAKEHVDTSAAECVSKVAEQGRMQDLLRRIIALEFTGRCSQRSVSVFQTICDALSESPMAVVKVMEVLDESFANSVKAGQQQQLMNCWYLVDSVMKLYRDRPEMLNAVVVALPHLLYQYVPWKGSDLAMESWMDRETDVDKYEHLFRTWGRTVPKEILDAIMELWNNGVPLNNTSRTFSGKD